MATKRNASVKGKCSVPTARKFGGDRFTRMNSTYKTKKSAQDAAKRHRGKGKSSKARVVKNPCGTGYHVYKRG